MDAGTALFFMKSFAFGACACTRGKDDGITRSSSSISSWSAHSSRTTCGESIYLKITYTIIPEFCVQTPSALLKIQMCILSLQKVSDNLLNQKRRAKDLE